MIIDLPAIETALDADGWAISRGLLSPDECTAMVALYADDARFRKRVVMEQHGYGQGTYAYFSYPLPDAIAGLRSSLYAQLVPVANRWSGTLGSDIVYPPTHAELVAQCHAAGQLRPTPLLLRYLQGDYNRLHQDVYGELLFPLQVVVLLSRPGVGAGADFTGGELVMTEQRARMQSRPMVLPLEQGDAAIIAVKQRPVQGRRGVHRVQLRHGVSALRSGERHTLGIIFHDAT